jgi:hypothetical protein
VTLGLGDGLNQRMMRRFAALLSAALLGTLAHAAGPEAQRDARQARKQQVRADGVLQPQQGALKIGDLAPDFTHLRS